MTFDILIWLLFAAGVTSILMFWLRIYFPKEKGKGLPKIETRIVSVPTTASESIQLDMAAVASDPHPSYALGEYIDKRWYGYKKEAFPEFERNFSRAYEFNSRVYRGGLDDFFFYVPDQLSWGQTVDALNSVGATEWAEILLEVIAEHGPKISVEATKGELHLPYLEKYNERLWSTQFVGEWISSDFKMTLLLDDYVRTHFALDET